MTRDMTRQQFKAALAAHGIKQVLLWLHHPDMEGTSVGMVLSSKGRIHRRASLAKMLREMDRYQDRQAA